MPARGWHRALLCGLALLLTAAAAYPPAPNFTRPDLQGRSVTLAAYRGHVVLLNFWATWCGPCRTEIPQFAAWQRQFAGPRGLQVIGVSMDDSAVPVRVFVRREHLPYPVVMGDARLGELYGGIYGLPVTFLIDRKGVIRDKIEGAADIPSLRRRLQQLLAQ